MWLGVLGHLEARDDVGRPIRVGGSVRRELLAALLCRAGEPVPAATLIEDLWGSVPPRTAPKTLQSHIVRLRTDLGRAAAAVVVTEGAAYRFDAGSVELDSVRFETALEDGLAAFRRGEDRAAIESFDAALALWRGEAYADFANAPFALGERMRLADLRAVAVETRTDAALRLGEAVTLVSELESRLRREPYRERSWEQLILALYRSGRQADALAAYRMARDRLATDLGVDPGPVLRLLEERILNQDPALLADPSLRSVGDDVVIGSEHCPYRGLDGYQTDDAAVFVGRERLTARLVGRLAEPGVVVVTGSSGSGKSSLLRAGVVPALRAGALPRSAAWRVETAVPADGLRPSPSADVLVVDQAEELFTVVDPPAAAEYFERLREFVDAGGRLVLVLRGDLFAALGEIPWVAHYAQREPVLVARMRDDELARVVVEPARRAGIAVASEVVEAVLDAAAGQTQPLPLISLALVRAWDNRADDAISLEAYEAGGGVVGAIEMTAEAVYARLPEDLKAEARRLLVRMAVREGATWVRSPMPRATETDSAASAVITLLADARLVTVTASRVDLSHDALLEQWPRLREWLTERVVAADLLQHLAAATNAWLAGGRRPTDLHRGPRLRAALDWRDAHPNDLSDDETAFIDASEAAAETELHEANARVALQVRTSRRLQRVVVGLALTLVLAIGGAVVAVAARFAADRSAAAARAAALSADARRLAALSLSSPDLATSALLAAASYRLQDSGDTRGALLSVLDRGQSALFRVPTNNRALRLAASGDGSRLYAYDNQGLIEVANTDTRNIVTTYDPQANDVVGVTNGDDDLVVNGEVDTATSSTEHLRVLDAASGRLIKQLGGDISSGFDQPSMTPDGRWIAAVFTKDLHYPGRTLAVYDAQNWSRPARTMVFPTDIIDIAAARNLVVAVTKDQTLYLIDAASMRIVAHARRGDMPTQTTAPGVSFVISPDGRHLAYTASTAGLSPLVLDTAHLAGTAAKLDAQPEPVTVLRFSGDGTELAVGSYGGAVNVYRTTDGSLVTALAGESGPVLGAAWTSSPAGARLYTDGLDSQIVAWNVSQTSRLISLTGHSMPAAPLAALIPGDRLFGTYPSLTGLVPGTAARLFDLDLRAGTLRSWPARLRTPEVPFWLSATSDASLGLVSIQDVTDYATRWQLWDLRGERLLADIHPPSTADQQHFLPAVISPDGKTAVASLGDGRLGVLALPSGHLEQTLPVEFSGDPGPPGQLQLEPYGYSPGQLLVTTQHLGSPDNSPVNNRVGVFDLARGRLLAQAGLGEDPLNTAAWSTDAALLAVGTLDGALRLYDARTLRLIRSTSNAQAGYVNSVSFSPDGQTILTSGTDGAMNFWDAATMVREGPRITTPGSDSNSWAWYQTDGDVAGLAPDGTHPGQSDERPFAFPARLPEWLHAVCTLAGSNITRAQWAHYIPDQHYRSVCQ